MNLSPLLVQRARTEPVVQRWLRIPWLPPTALALVCALDLAIEARDWPLPVLGLLDDPAHFATACILLAAFLPGRAARLAPWAMAGSVFIDLDHVPLYVWGALSSGSGARPVTHSLATVVVLGVTAATIPRFRTPLSGLALGVLLHFVRDIGTGPGLPLLWPLTARSSLLPYAAYLAPVAAVAAGATVRNVLLRRRRAGERTRAADVS